MRLPQPGSWLRYVPADEQALRVRRWRLLWLRMQWQKRRVKLVALAILDLLFCLVPFWLGLYSLAVLALVPLILVPLVGALAYWLTWQEYHR
ncbi:MAG: hypothetical protein ACO3GW_04490 [Vulcanococcus sp.]